MIRLWGKSVILGNDETLSVIRRVAVNYVEGRPVNHSEVSFPVVGNVQPLNGRDLLIVPEGDRYKEQYWLFVNNCQFAVDQGLDIAAQPARLIVNDQVTRLNVKYQVQSVEDWGSYCRVRIMRIDVGPNRNP